MRCGLCSAFVEAHQQSCRACGLAWPRAAVPASDDARFSRIASQDRLRLSGGLIRFDGLIFGFETLRMLASRFERTAICEGPARYLLSRIPAGLLSSTVRLADGTSLSAFPITLGMIARPSDIAVLSLLATSYSQLFSSFAVMIDGADEDASMIREALEAAVNPADIRVAAAPLNKDFAAQRNRLQRLAGTSWILHLDTDEKPDDRLVRNLPWIVADAVRQGDRVVGFPRLNLVDGRPSAFYPDFQYRLLRSDVSFTGKVHENPLAGVHWRRIQHCLAGGISHHLSSERVKARSVQYEDIAAGAGKPPDERLLLQEWCDVEERIWTPDAHRPA